jgi:hypothetical protein
MTASQKFSLIYAPITKGHLRAIESRYYSLIRKEIETQLLLEPDVKTRNRKPLKRPVIFGDAQPLGKCALACRTASGRSTG